MSENNDQVDESLDEIEEGSENASTFQMSWASVYLVLFFGSIYGGLFGLIYFGYIDFNISVIAEVNVGQYIQWFIAGSLGLTFVGAVISFAILMPGSMLNGLGGIAYGVAKNQGYMDEEEDSNS